MNSERPQISRLREIFAVFLRLGLTSFGGPIAHLGYFRDEFVTRRKWFSDDAYADIIALCQFLPGPASSQAGFVIGVQRGGLSGGIAAWIGFTLPSAVLMVALAYGAAIFSGTWGEGIINGLKLVAVAIVAQAIWGMARTLTPDLQRIAIAIAAAAIAIFFENAAAQISLIAAAALLGILFCRKGSMAQAAHMHWGVRRGPAIVALVLFVAIFAAMPFMSKLNIAALSLFGAFYQAGALVFGGGHVVLPLLEATLVGPGWVDHEVFLAGYGAAQAMPGPLFTFAAYLGAVALPYPNGLAGAAIGLVAIFLPGLLLVYGAMPFWEMIRRQTLGQAAMKGANAAVVGILLAAFYDPVWTSGISGLSDVALALAGFVALVILKAPPWTVVLVLATAGAIFY
ncbi:chromate efflux transporter [Phyllobacterium sp. YR531]|uniref:chromate efflux transporter n=1 Tax=Phyllobacterium sp. YR531 TaxID=1144343 RepID=UPI00026F52F7|nr:chromate efflux transporter [Phyllobacterium sp. YR531]EJM98726.1 chromate transporter, chromate ion transporter family [Phyllobacterium sp. YR531]